MLGINNYCLFKINSLFFIHNAVAHVGSCSGNNVDSDDNDYDDNDNVDDEH